MDRDPERHSLSPDALQKIYETRVSPRLFRHVQSVEQPTAIVLGGQPGSGKTPMQNHAAQEFSQRGGIVKIIGVIFAPICRIIRAYSAPTTKAPPSIQTGIWAAWLRRR